jgi:hypothetical protein
VVTRALQHDDGSDAAKAAADHRDAA